MTDPTLTWSGTDVELVLALGPDSPVSLVSVRPIGRVRVQIGSFGLRRSGYLPADETPMSSNARVWSAVGSVRSSKAAPLLGPGGQDPVAVRVASSASSVGKLWTGNPSGVGWSRSFAIAAAERSRGPTGLVRAGCTSSRNRSGAQAASRCLRT